MIRCSNPEKFSDPLDNRDFLRAWGEPPALPPVRGMSRRASLQHARSALARLLRQASQADPETAAAAIREADRLRRRVGVTWTELVAQRRAA